MVRMNVSRCLVQALLAAFLVLPSPAVAGVTGKIVGHVVNAVTGESIPGVSVVVEGISRGAATDIEGRYMILNVPPGKYVVRGSGVGFTPVVVKNVGVSIDLTTTVDFKLEENTVQVHDVIEVVAERPIVTKDLTASTAVVDADKISSLPVTDIQEVLELQAGMVGGTVRGGRKGEVVYAIDGVPMTDVYDGSTVIDVNPNAIEELQFVSGAFNAEYGRALSGYVNIATKDGGQKFAGSLTTYGGGYLSSHTDIFRGINQFHPFGIKNIEGSVSGPVLPEDLFFFADARYHENEGWMFGKKVFNPWDITTNRGSDYALEDRYIFQHTGDGSLVGMNWSKELYLQGKLSYKPVSTFTFNYNILLDRLRYQDYEHLYAYNPDGRVKRFRTGLTQVASFTHALSPEVFYQASASYFFKEYKHYAYEDVNDPRYTDYRLLTQEPTEIPSFYTGGTDREHFRRTTSTWGGKIDMTAQISRVQQLKYGVDMSFHKLTFDQFTLIQESGTDDPSVSGNPYAVMHVPNPEDTTENLSIDRYTRKPREFSAYVQDKIELNDLIINLGVRFDYFSPDGHVLNDPTDPDIYRPLKPENIEKTIEERRTYWYRKATEKHQFSPRLGVAFPITDKGVVHFSYGHFFQIPNYTYLYQNPEYKFGTGTGNLGIAGNPDLKPEQTIIGEVGLQQGLTQDLSIDVTGYFRNIKNLTGTRADEIILYGGTSRYSQYVNSDFGFVRGIVLTLTKRITNGWGMTIDYTLQTAKGNASDPSATRNQLAGGEQPEVQLVPLDWDQRHTVNATLNYMAPGQWGISLIGHYGSGFPYTPSESMDVSDLLTNSELKPSTLSVDLRVNKDFMLGDILFTAFLRVFNLFDAKNQLSVYSDSGTADWTESEYNYRKLGYPEVVNTLTEYYRNPLYYSEPRRIEFGFSVNLK